MTIGATTGRLLRSILTNPERRAQSFAFPRHVRAAAQLFLQRVLTLPDYLDAHVCALPLLLMGNKTALPVMAAADRRLEKIFQRGLSWLDDDELAELFLSH